MPGNNKNTQRLPCFAGYESMIIRNPSVKCGRFKKKHHLTNNNGCFPLLEHFWSFPFGRPPFDAIYRKSTQTDKLESPVPCSPRPGDQEIRSDLQPWMFGWPLRKTFHPHRWPHGKNMGVSASSNFVKGDPPQSLGAHFFRPDFFCKKHTHQHSTNISMFNIRNLSTISQLY